MPCPNYYCQPGNEKEVGNGIKASGVPREEIFLTTKLNNIDHSNPAEALEQSLKHLDTPYLDLCTIMSIFLLSEVLPVLTDCHHKGLCIGYDYSVYRMFPGFRPR